MLRFSFLRYTSIYVDQAIKRARFLKVYNPMTFDKKIMKVAYTKTRETAQNGSLYWWVHKIIEQKMKNFSQSIRQKRANFEISKTEKESSKVKIKLTIKGQSFQWG